MAVSCSDCLCLCVVVALSHRAFVLSDASPAGAHSLREWPLAAVVSPSHVERWSNELTTPHTLGPTRDPTRTPTPPAHNDPRHAFASERLPVGRSCLLTPMLPYTTLCCITVNGSKLVSRPSSVMLSLVVVAVLNLLLLPLVSLAAVQ